MDERKEIVIVTDAWYPQVNGVVTTLSNVINELTRMGYQPSVITHHNATIKIPTWYPHVYMSFLIAIDIPEGSLVHISTPEGFVGRAVRHYCNRHRIEYTTAYHTHWVDYLPLPKRLTEWYMKRVHRKSKAVLVPTISIAKYCESIGMKNVSIWSRGVNRELFHPRS